MKEVEVKMVVDSTEAIESVEKLTDKVEDVGEAAKDSKKGFGSMAKGIKAVGTALKAAGIGLVVALVAGLTEAFSRNKRVMDAVGLVMGTIQQVFSQIATALIDTYDAVAKTSDNFDALGKTISGLLTIAFAPLKIAFYGIIAASKGVKLAYENMFGDEESIAKAQANLDLTNEKLKQIAIETNQAGRDIVDNIGEAIDEVSNITTIAGENLSKVSLKVARNQAEANQLATQGAAIAEAQAGRLVAQYEREAELQRQIRDDVSKSVTERQEANDKLATVLDEQEKALLRQADAIIAGAQAELQKNDSIENQAALIAAMANKDQVRADIAGKRSEQLVNETALLKEQGDLSVTATNALLERQRIQREFDAEQLSDSEKIEAQLASLAIENQAIIDDLEYKKTFFCNVSDINLIKKPSLFSFISISKG